MWFWRLARLGGVVVVASVAAPTPARASGYSVARFGGEHGHPTTTNATALYYNPAGIGMSEGYHVYADVNLAFRSLKYSHELQDPGTPEGDDGRVAGANDGENTLFNVLASPMIGVTAKFGDVALGAGFYTPFGGQATWKKNESQKDNPNYAGPYDGVQRWYAISGEILSSFVTLAGAYHIRPARLSIGVGANLILSRTHTIRAKTASGDNNLDGEGRSVLDVKGTDFSLGFGVLHETIEKKLWLGASYQSRPNFSGMKPQEGEFKFFQGGTETVNDAELETDLPDVIRIGGRYRPAEDMEIRLFGDYQRWSVLERQCVYKKGTSCNVDATGTSPNGDTLFNQQRDWNDTFGVRAGFSKWLSKPVEVFVGVGYSSNAVPDETLEPALPDWNTVTAGVGGRFELADKIFVAASYTHFISIPRDSDGKFENDTKWEGATRNPDAGGSYKQMVGVVNANIDIGF